MKRDRYRTGLLLGVFTRRCLLAEAEKDEPGVKYPGLRIVVGFQNLPMRVARTVVAGLDYRPVECHSPLTVAAPRGTLTHFA